MSNYRESAYLADRSPLYELDHEYGDSVHICSEPFLLTQLAMLCSPETTQPRINQLIETCYVALLQRAFNREFPRIDVRRATRMAATNGHGYYEGMVFDRTVSAVTVNIARAGTFPSHLCFHMLNQFLDPDRVRQDHVIMERQTDAEGRVIGASMHGSKIGGDVEGRILLFPDPMAATGSSLIKCLETYRNEVEGTPARIINVHMIVTPNYLRAMREAHPEAIIYAIRLDRGLSDDEVLRMRPGAAWERENGLDEHQYIVPGGGGFGEILNNAYV